MSGTPVPNTEDTTPRCVVVDADDLVEGKQKAGIFSGVCADSVGSRALCMHLVTIPPGGAGIPHLHDSHETALFVLEGSAVTRFGDRLQHEVTVNPGQFLYIPAGVPHVPHNVSDTVPVRAVLARTDPNEQESVTLLPNLHAPTAT